MKELCSCAHTHDNKVKNTELIDKLPDLNESNRASYIFSLLSDSTRLRILWLLCHSEQCVTNIASFIDMSPPAVSHHLRFLKQSQIIISEKRGKETFYKLSDTNYAILTHKMIDDIFYIECPFKSVK